MALAWLFAPTAPALAATINVGGTCSLANAINAANNDAASGGCSAGSGADTIILSANATITLTAALPNLASAITIRGNNSTIARSPVASEFRILSISRLATVVVQQTTISGGSSGSSSGGGGIFNDYGTLTLTNSVVSGNSSFQSGGGIHNRGTLTAVGGSVSENTSSYGGGGIYNVGTLLLRNITVSANTSSGAGGISNAQTLTIEDSTISGNSVTGKGGGLSNEAQYSQFTVSVRNSSITGNTAGLGGGVINTGTLNLVESRVSNNRAIGFSGSLANGGGLYNDVSGTLGLNNSTVSSNTASEGGGVFNTHTLKLTGTTISGNQADRVGGGLYNGGLLEASNTTVSGNHAGGSGGGLNNRFGSATIVDSTISDNSAGERGGGIFSDAGALDVFALRRNLVAGNSAAVGSEVTFGNVMLSADEFNVFGHAGLTNAQAFSGFTPDVADRTATSDGSNPKALAAILSPLALNTPGTTPVHALPTGSPGIDSGGTTCSATDQRGVARPQGTACDVGAFEKDVGPVPPKITIAGASVTEGNTGTVNLSFKVRLSAPAPAAVRVNFATQDGTAKKASDYVAKTGTLTIAKGKSSGDIVIQVKGDTAIEPNETFKILLSNPRGASITTGTATGTIRNDDRPRLSISDVSLAEGNSGQKNATFTVRLSPAPRAPVTVKFATVDGTAKKPTDYVAKSGTLNFAAGQTAKTIQIVVKGDRTQEANETFRVNLSAATGASIADGQGLGTITNDD